MTDKSKAATAQSSVKICVCPFIRFPSTSSVLFIMFFFFFVFIVCIYLYIFVHMFLFVFIIFIAASVCFCAFSFIVSLPTSLVCVLHFLVGGYILFRKHESNNVGSNFQTEFIGIVKEFGQFQTSREVQLRKKMFRYAKA